MVGHHGLCCHLQGYGSKRPFRMCYVTHDNLDNPYEICTKANSDTIFDAVHSHIQTINKGVRGTILPTRQKLKDISQLPVIPAFDGFDFGGVRGGLLQFTPVETLYALLKGLIERSLKCLYDYRVLVIKKTKGKSETKAKNDDSSSSEEDQDDSGEKDQDKNVVSISEHNVSSKDKIPTSSEHTSSSKDNVQTSKNIKRYFGQRSLKGEL